MKSIIYYLILITALSGFDLSYGQTTYKDDNGTVHLAGSLELETLQKDTLFSAWFGESYASFDIKEESPQWAGRLKNLEVDIYLGTWCGDSKNWVPKFVKLWDGVGLSRDQLHFTALYNGDDKYKQGPNGEEKGLGIHRVPTFIFKRDGKEIARIVETPCNDLETDLAQIALGYPSAPNYRAATYLTSLLAEQTVDAVYKDFRTHIYEAYELVSKVNELNTLGYVYLRAGELDKALIVFQINSYLFKFNPNVYDSLAEALLKKGMTDEAIVQYEKVLEMDPENKNAIEQLAMLKE